MIDLITNEELQLLDVPKNDDMKGANKFAHTFDGYEKSLEDMVKTGKLVLSKLKTNEIDSLKLSELRKSLFFYFRQGRFTNHVPGISIVNTYLSLIRNRIIENKRD